ncbi:hypothetical protein [Sphingobium sp. Ant17]|uniref:hypothetical protein n=1 Tax=Sphingobium sp. Ant17 TaxID=1461752 RepID=UPI00126882A7|nr:hypothetical protein [Sphingobium sp. Ant17]
MQLPIPDGFFHLRPDRSTGCGDSGYYLSYHGGRDGDTLCIWHETKSISSNANPRCRILCFCSQSSRSVTDEEIRSDPYLHSTVQLYGVNTIGANEQVEGLWNAQDFLTKYFEYQANRYAPSDPAGKKKRVMVEVAFGTAWYGMNH